MPESTPPNPLAAGLSQSLSPQPCTLLIFGGSGELARRKLLPALYNLALDGVLPTNFAVMGFALDPLDDARYRAFARAGVEKFSRRPVDDEHWPDLERSVFFVSGSFDDPAAYAALKRRLDEIEPKFGIPGNRIFYLAVPPSLIGLCAENLSGAGLVNSPGQGPFTRVIVEKPFGRDLASAQALNAIISRVFDERQVFRIDHYLGKETVQNLLVLRFGNSIFEPLWNQKYIDHVQITVAEDEGVGTRARYYEEAGALRDMVQNHILQLLCVTAMEPPWSMNADVVRDHKLEVLECLRPLAGRDVDRFVVRAQYGPGFVHGEPVPDYRREEGVRPDSVTETYVAIKMFVDNWRWAGVPFYLRTGKRLPKRATEIAVQFKPVPEILFNTNPTAPLAPNVLALRIQPDEGLSLKIAAKRPGPKVRVWPVRMDFRYDTTVRRAVAGGLRAPPARRHGGRRDIVHEARRRRGRLGLGDEHPRGLGAQRHALAARVPRRDVGPARGRPPHSLRRPRVEDPMTEARTEPAVVSHPPKPVELTAIERELSRLWKPPGPNDAPQGAVTRACMSNLLIYCASREQACGVPEEIDTIVRLHPSRVLLLVNDAGAPTAEIEAYVSAHCHLAPDRHQVCCEQVTVRASGDAVQRLPSTARSLLLGDLPTSLWWATDTPPTLRGGLFEELRGMADQVIYSSLDWSDPGCRTIATAAWALEAGLSEPAIADLAWRRLDPWRSLMSQALDPSALPGAQESMTFLEVEHGPRALTQAWLVVGWLATRLGWLFAGAVANRGREVVWTFRAATGVVVRVRVTAEGDAELKCVRVGWRAQGRPVSLTFAAAAPGRLSAAGEGVAGEPRVLATPVRSRAMLVAMELQDLERDPVFRDALRVARDMAEALNP
jgi:glucose-6-phosphate 1-dehydrogenase